MERSEYLTQHRLYIDGEEQTEPDDFANCTTLPCGIALRLTAATLDEIEGVAKHYGMTISEVPMTDLADLSPEELDRLACKAVGIESSRTLYLARRKKTQHLEKFYRGEWFQDVDHDLFEEPRVVVDFPPVSQEPNACAMLKAAICGSLLIRSWAGHWGSSIDGEGWNEQKTEERAVAFAVVAWAQAKGE